MANQQNLKEQRAAKEAEIEVIVQKISSINRRIFQLSQKYTSESAKIQHKLTRVQYSRPRGNPANQWPHRPMTNSVRNFYQIKERKEREVMQNKDLLKQTYDHSKAILTTQRLVLENAKFDIESQIRQIDIQLH